MAASTESGPRDSLFLCPSPPFDAHTTADFDLCVVDRQDLFLVSYRLHILYMLAWMEIVDMN